MKQFFINILLSYFQILAKIQLRKNNPTIIGVTGTAGKTVTLTAIDAVLKDHKKIKVSYKANSETGIPLNILGLLPKSFSIIDWLRLVFLAPIKLISNWEKYEFYVAEMGIDSPTPPKNMGYLLKIIQPKIGILLNARPMHSQPFDNVVDQMAISQYGSAAITPEQRRILTVIAIANEKEKMITSLPSVSDGGVAILNADQPEIIALAQNTQAKVLTFGKSSLATVQIIKTQRSINGTNFKFIINDKNEKIKTPLSFPKYLLPDHFAHSFGAAICVGLSQSLPPDITCQSLEKNFILPPGRSSLISGINGSWIIDSSYNSSTQPLLDLLDMIDNLAKNDIQKFGKKIALLGDIRELGKESQLEHELIAKKTIETCDEILLIGPEMKKFALPILKSAHKKASWFANAFDASDYLKQENNLNKNDILLVKGSQNTLLLEIAVEQLMKNPHNASKLLCRREKIWEKKRKEI